MKFRRSLQAISAFAAAITATVAVPGMTMADDTSVPETSLTAEDISAPENTTGEASSAETADSEEFTAEKEWIKADLSEYDASFSLISYEKTTPDMFRLGDGLESAEPAAAVDEKELSEVDKAILRKKRKNLKKASPILGKKERSATPTAVEVYTSGGELKNIPEPQEGKVVEHNPGEFAVQTFGWGHGVGMSQNGANFYATYSGWTYQDILYHYYPGTHLMNTGLTDEEEITIGHEPSDATTLEIISRVVYNEMGGVMNVEAMKAQAVAAYTYIKYNDDDTADLIPKEDPPQNVIDACKEVLGEALYYNDDYALTVFSASSGGCSSNCGEIFYQDLPYLRSVPSDYDAAYDPHYGTVTYIDAATMREMIEERYQITLSDDPANWIQPVYSEETGYANEVCIDGQLTVKGYAFTLAMGIKSCKFNVTYTDFVVHDDDDEQDGDTPEGESAEEQSTETETLPEEKEE